MELASGTGEWNWRVELACARGTGEWQSLLGVTVVATGARLGRRPGGVGRAPTGAPTGAVWVERTGERRSLLRSSEHASKAAF